MKNAITTLLQSIVKFFDGERIRREENDAYLNEATSIYDLEMRMRSIDQKNSQRTFAGGLAW